MKKIVVDAMHFNQSMYSIILYSSLINCCVTQTFPSKLSKLYADPAPDLNQIVSDAILSHCGKYLLDTVPVY